MAALNPHEHSKLVIAMCGHDVVGRKCHGHAVRMTHRLLVHGIDQLQRALGKVAKI